MNDPLFDKKYMERDATDPEFHRKVWIQTLTEVMLDDGDIPKCGSPRMTPTPSVEGQQIVYRYRKPDGEQCGKFSGIAVRDFDTGQLYWV